MRSAIGTGLLFSAAATLFSAAMAFNASACTTLYVGGNLTEEKTPFVARTEDYGWDMNKLWFISEAGQFKAGETYIGCPAYGAFEWPLTHDSYRFTYFTNDVFNGKCPECGEEHPHHWSYTEFGTNEKGVSVSATETIYGNPEVKKIDPNVTEKVNGIVGIEETDIPAVLLAEADSARAGVALLGRIYGAYGAYADSGLFICDKNEVWYIENCSGSQYIAVKLNNDMLFLEPNIAIIGEIDLDDHEQVIASDRLIQTARDAGTFVGNEAENIINYRASYALLERQKEPGIPSTPLVGAPRMVDGLAYLNQDYRYTDAELHADNSVFTVSNLRDGSIVPLYTNIRADRVLRRDDVFNFYKLSSVGKPSNQEIEIFQLFQDPALETKYSTIGWVALGNMSYNVFVPYYPMLIDDMYAGYRVSMPVVTKSDQKPDSFCTWRDKDSKYVRYPDHWRDSYYFSFEGLGGYIRNAELLGGAPLSDEQRNHVSTELQKLQNTFYADLVTVKQLRAAGTAERTLATENGRSMAQRAHQKALELIDSLTR
ncbi:MAG: C69 family dipeptidase [Stomatobaculum sp.]